MSEPSFQSATVALQAQTIIGLQAKLAEAERTRDLYQQAMDSMENQLDRLEEAATELTPYPEGYRPTAWEAVFELPGELRKAREKLAEAEAKEGPLNAERITLDELLEVLAKWKAVASGKTCVSFENLCYGASSLWHQTHRDNFRKIDRKPMELSRWVLEYSGFVHDDFPEQVLGILNDLRTTRNSLGKRAEAAEAKLAAVREAAREGVLLATESTWLLGDSTHKVAKLFGGILDLTKE